MVKIIFLQPIYYPYLIAFLLSAFLLYRLIRSLVRKQKDNAPILIPTGNRIVVFLFWGCCCSGECAEDASTGPFR